MTTPDLHRPAILGGMPLRPQGPPVWPLRDPAIESVLVALASDGDWGRYHGPWCGQLTALLQSLLQVPHVLLCSSGTAAVELALRGLGVSSGDEVILAAYDFKANFTNVLCVGATPVLVDVRPDDWQLDVDRLDAACTPRTRCVLASHLHGGLVDLPRLRHWCDARRIPLLEDACQASGAVIAGRAAGATGDVGTLSFGGSKLLTAGRGGAVATFRADVAQRMRLYTQRGNDAYPLSEMQAAVLGPQCARLSAQHRRRADAVRTLTAELIQLGVSPLASTRVSGDPAYYKLGLRYDAARFDGLSRERFIAAARAEGVAIAAGFRGLHQIHARSRFRSSGPLDNAAAAAAGLLTLHHPVLLGDEQDLTQVVTAVARIQAFAADIQACDLAAGAADVETHYRGG